MNNITESFSRSPSAGNIEWRGSSGKGHDTDTRVRHTGDRSDGAG